MLGAAPEQTAEWIAKLASVEAKVAEPNGQQ
jgi:hypothetical protein